MSVEEDLLVSDFHECFAQMRHYDDGFRETVGFGFGGVLAVVAAYAALAEKYGFTASIGFSLALLTLLAGLMGLLLVMWLARNRVYYAFVCRYVNEIRGAYILTAPANVENKARMYTKYNLPPIFNPWSTQTLQVYFLSLSTALLLAGSAGTFIATHAVAPGSKPAIAWVRVVLAFLFFSALQIGGVLVYWARKDRHPSAEAAVWRSSADS